MSEHDDDLEAEVEEDAEFETAEFPILDEDDETNVEGEDPGQAGDDIDPDESEI
jgi:hypothetical protein